jgi:hypothetical protein
MDYLEKEVRELGEKAAATAIADRSLVSYENDDMNDDPVKAMAQDSWDYYYSSVALEAFESLKPDRRKGLPSQAQLLQLLFDNAFFPAVQERLGTDD